MPQLEIVHVTPDLDTAACSFAMDEMLELRLGYANRRRMARVMVDFGLSGLHLSRFQRREGNRRGGFLARRLPLAWNPSVMPLRRAEKEGVFMAHETQPSGADSAVGEGAGHEMRLHPASNRLGAFLCWAVVFADIGTSVYYTPGILYSYNGIGRLAGFFVFLTLIVFLLLTLKYAEVSVRFPEGGGVVTVATHGINPWAGAVGGMFILVDYFLTSAISSLSGLLYFQAILPRLGVTIHFGLGRFAVPVALTLLITLVVVALLGVLNWYGIKESATVSAFIATAAFLSDIVILILIFERVPLHTIGQVFAAMFTGKTMTPLLLLTGFAGAFLAFSAWRVSHSSPR